MCAPAHSQACRRPWLHYRGLVNDLATAEDNLISARANAAIAIDAANTNGEQLRKTQEQHRLTVTIMEDLQEELADYADASSAAEAEIRKASPEMNPPVPGVLEQLRKRRFGGAK